MTDRTPVVLIVGGGFAGLSAAKALRNAPVQVFLIDRTNHSPVSAASLPGCNVGVVSRADRIAAPSKSCASTEHDRTDGRSRRRG